VLVAQWQSLLVKGSTDDIVLKKLLSFFVNVERQPIVRSKGWFRADHSTNPRACPEGTTELSPGFQHHPTQRVVPAGPEAAVKKE
jgi:hypothetical protein